MKTHPALNAVARIAVLAGTLTTITACVPDNSLRLLPTDASLRTIQSRTIAAPSEQAVIDASVSLLQDLNFTVDRLSPQLGVISATSHQEAQKIELAATKSAGLLFADAACLLLVYEYCGFYEDARNTIPEDVRMTVLVAPVENTSNLYRVRFSMRSVQPELAFDQDRYQALFEKLSKSIFLENSL